jgi:hypothetical protein
MDGTDWLRWLSLPAKCGEGHPWEAGRLNVSWGTCDCLALTRSHYGHVLVTCEHPGCSETWQTDVDTIIGVIEDRQRAPTGSDHRAMAVLDPAYPMLRQASAHQMTLLKASHPSAARLAVLRSWIQDCISAVQTAGKLAALLGRRLEEPHVNDIAGQLAAMLDAFHLYASTLESFRSTCRAATGSPQRQPAALSAIAEDEVALLGYRAALRTSMQQLITLLDPDR